jgi:hypothetical protein
VAGEGTTGAINGSDTDIVTEKGRKEIKIQRDTGKGK